MSRILITLLSLAAAITITSPLYAAEVVSDLSPEEEEELTLDESVMGAEQQRLDLLIENIGLNLRVDDPDEAARLFRRTAASYQGRDNLTTKRVIEAGYAVAHGFIKAGKFKEALAFADELIGAAGEDSIACYLKALALKGAREPDAAAEWEEKARSFKANDEEYRLEVAQNFFEQERFDTARSELLRILEINPDDGEYSVADANAYLFLGRIEFHERKYQASAKRYEELAQYLQKHDLLRVESIIPQETVSAHLNAAREFELKGEHDKELEVLERAARYFPTYPSLMSGIAAALARQEKYEDALKKYEQLLEKYPDVPDPYVGYGDVLLTLGRKEEAEAQFKKAVDLYSEGIEDGVTDTLIAQELNNLAWFYATHSRELEKGIELSKRSIELRPKEAAYLDTLAELYYMSGDKKNAVKYIKEAIETDPPHLLYYQQQLEKFQDKKQSQSDRSE